MAAHWARSIRRACSLAGLVALMALGTGPVGFPGSASASAAAAAGVTGSACGYYVNVGLFGGPQQLRGCGQTAGGDASSSPKVELPAGGSTTPVTGSNPAGAKATYGPAAIFAGIWPEAAAQPPPSGPISVSTEGTPAGGSVTSTADIVLRTPADPNSPGGFGPGPVEGDELHSKCTATETSVTGSARFVNGKLTITTTADGTPLAQEPIPENPPVNYTRSGVITNVGDVFTVVFNQQIVNPDGSLTVNAFHMYLFGPTAVGESVGGQVTCGTTPSALSSKDTVPPGCGPVVVEPKGPEDPTPKVPRTERIGVFDPGGLQSITNIQATNGTVQIGNPSGAAYLQLTPGQTGPLAMIATRTDESKPMTWSFDATDKAGNVTRSSQCPTDSTATGGGGTPGTTTPTTAPPSNSGAAGGTGTNSAASAAAAARTTANTGTDVMPLVRVAAALVGGGLVLLLLTCGRRVVDGDRYRNGRR